MIWLLGWVWWLVLPVRKRLAIDNYQQAFPDRDPGELRRTVGGVVWGYFELLFGARASFEGLEKIEGPALLLASHTGSWDVCLVSFGSHKPTTIFVKSPSNPLAARVIEWLRRRVDIELLPPRGSKNAGYQALARNRVLIFVQDQRHNKGITVPFFGRPAKTSAAFAAMAWRSRVPIYGTVQWRAPDGSHRVKIKRLDVDIPDDRDEAIEALTRACQGYYEDQIRERPDSWWWLHNRWR